ncbi:MAG: hypothetical protein RL685_7578, partial [Pseudomonadota bacterium]
MSQPLSAGEKQVFEHLSRRLKQGQPEASPPALSLVPSASGMERRVFLKLSSFGGLALGLACASEKAAQMANGNLTGSAGSGSAGSGGGMIPGEPGATEQPPGNTPLQPPSEPAEPVVSYDLSAYVRIGDDESITIFIGPSEMG